AAARAAAADDHADLRLVLDAADAGRHHDRPAWTHDSGRGLDEHQRRRRQRLVLLRRVVLVVQADAHHLRRFHGREETLAVARDLVTRVVSSEEVAFEQAPAASLFDHVTRGPLVFDPIELLHLAVSSTLLDCGLRFGGVVLSTAMTA